MLKEGKLFRAKILLNLSFAIMILFCTLPSVTLPTQVFIISTGTDLVIEY